MGMVWQVIVRPNTAFAIIRDSYPVYFRTSIYLMLSCIVVTTLADIPLLPEMGNLRYLLIETITFSLGGGIAAAVFTYYTSRWWGGSRNWKQVFSVMFYAYVVLTITSVMFSVASSSLESPIPDVFGFVGTLGIVWVLVVSVKAIKVVNGFSTWKAIAVVAVVATATTAVTLGASALYSNAIHPTPLPDPLGVFT